MSDCLNLLHFHLGSQITNIRQIKGAVNEAVRVADIDQLSRMYERVMELLLAQQH